LIIYNPSQVGRKIGLLCSTNEKLLTLINLHPNGLLSADYISALRGCCALKFVHALEIDQGLLAHTPGTPGSPKNFNRENLKFAPKFSVLESIISGIVEVFSRNFPNPGNVPRGRGDNVGTKFGSPPPHKKIGRA